MAFLHDHLQPAEKRLREEKKARDLRLGKTVPSNVFRLPDRTTTPVKVIEPIGVKPIEPVQVPITESEEDRKRERERVLLALKAEFDSLKDRFDAIMEEDDSPIVSVLPVKPIIKIVCDYYEVTRAELMSPRREQRIMRARHVGMYLAKELTLRTMAHIGDVFGRDRTSVLDGTRKIEARRKIDPELNTDIENLTSLIKAAL